MSSQPRKKIQFEKSVETYNLILDAVLAVIKDAGLAGIGIHQVVKKSGFSIGTIYLYFDNTEAMLEGLLRREVLELSNRVQGKLAALPLSLPLDEKLEVLFSTVLKDKNFSLYKKLLTSDFALAGTKTGTSVSQLLQMAIGKAVDEGILAQADENLKNKKIFLLIHSLRGLISADHDYDLKTYAKSLAEVSMAMLRFPGSKKD